MLFERRSWRDIAARIGGGFSYDGIAKTLRNPIWKGIRRYSVGRETPLEVRVIDKPLIAEERWEAAQVLILEKRARWAQTKRKEKRPFLLTGLLRCGCGNAMYIRCGAPKHPRCYYYCSTQFRRGPSCGAPSVRQDVADREVERLVSAELLDAAFLRSVLDTFRSGEPVRDQKVENLARQREQREAERQRLLRITLRGDCTEADFARESKRIEAEIRDLDRLAPPPTPPALDPAKLVVRITRAFARFGKQPLDERRDLLRVAFREIVFDHGAITGMTLNGGLLDGVNLSARSAPGRWHWD
jgi:hypothetical protein